MSAVDPSSGAVSVDPDLARLVSAVDPLLVVSAVHHRTWPVPLPVESGDVRGAALRFRQARGLESGDRLRSWLSGRGLDAAQFRNHLERRVSASGPDIRGVEELWVDAVCCGLWETEAVRLGRARAAAELVGVQPPNRVAVEALSRSTFAAVGASGPWEESAADFLGLETARALFVESISAQTIAIAVDRHRLEWTSYVLATDDRTSTVMVRGEELPRRAGGRVHAAAPGSRLDELELRGSSATVWWLLDRHRPDPNDPWVRERVADVLLDERVMPLPARRDDTRASVPPEPATKVRRGSRWHRNNGWRVPFIAQLDSDDCGAACLAMIAASHGRRVAVHEVRELTNLSAGGSTLTSIIDAGRQLGFDVTGFELSDGALDDLTLPAIAHWEGDHWIVVEHVARDVVHVVDPAIGRRSIVRDAFERGWTRFVAVVHPVANDDGSRADEVRRRASAVRWVLPLLRPHRRSIAAALVLTAGAAAAEVTVPLLVQRIVDAVVARSGLSMRSVAWLLGAVVVAVGLDLSRQRLLVSTSLRLDGDLLDTVTARLLRLPLSYFLRRRVGDIERRVTGLGEVRRVLLQQGIDAVTAVALLVFVLIALALTSWPLALLLCATAPFYAVLMRYSSQRLRPLFASMEEAFGRYASGQLDLLRGVESVKVLGAESQAHARMQGAFRSLRDRVGPATRSLATYGVVVRAAGMATMAMFVIVGGTAVSQQRLSLGGFVAALALVGLALPAIATVLGTWDDVQVSAVLLERVRDVLVHEVEHEGTPVTAAGGRLSGRVEVAALVHRPRGATHAVLDGIDLDLAPGTFVAVVGRSGSGKSTLLRLLAGLDTPTSGVIRYDGVPMDRLDPITLRRQLGFVLQVPYVFDATIAENVAFAAERVDDDAVWAALDAAALASFVASLPLGLRTRVGEGGMSLAGGEAQRLVLARALYHQPTILLLDEPTSALDADNEDRVRTNLLSAAKGRTVLLATHRLRAAADADEVLVLDHGRVVERGPHAALLAADGLYAHLWHQQMGGISREGR